MLDNATWCCWQGLLGANNRINNHSKGTNKRLLSVTSTYRPNFCQSLRTFLTKACSRLSDAERVPHWQILVPHPTTMSIFICPRVGEILIWRRVFRRAAGIPMILSGTAFFCQIKMINMMDNVVDVGVVVDNFRGFLASPRPFVTPPSPTPEKKCYSGVSVGSIFG